MRKRFYIIWDWNGTLLDDSQACVDALNAMLKRRRLATIDLDRYRREFSFPARGFYRRLGMHLEFEDWNALAREYHDEYLASPRRSLAKGAEVALRFAASLGAGQSIVSALRQDLLDDATESFGVRGFFDEICGTDNLDGASKTQTALALAARLSAADAADETVVIGDSLHDKEIADAIGARCVLYTGGSHAPERLSPYAPVADSLAGCVHLAIG